MRVGVRAIDNRRVKVLAALATTWAALILLAPWLPVPAAGLVYLLGGRLCHQIAERSFHLDGAQLPVCARCVGINLGVAVGFVLSSGPRRMARAALRHPASVRTIILAAAALNVVTLWSASNPIRATAGALLGIAVALAIGTVDYGRWPSPRRIKSALPQPRI